MTWSRPTRDGERRGGCDADGHHITAFIKSVRSEGPVPVPDSEFAPTAFTHDSLTRLGPSVAAFTTPAGVAGLGTYSDLAPSRDPIRGVAVLDVDPDEPNLSLLDVRLGRDANTLEKVLLRLNRACMEQSSGC